jgi:hypothetical protein
MDWMHPVMSLTWLKRPGFGGGNDRKQTMLNGFEEPR